MNTTDDPGFTTTEPLVRLGQGETETHYGEDQLRWREIVILLAAALMPLAVGVVIGLVIGGGH